MGLAALVMSLGVPGCVAATEGVDGAGSSSTGPASPGTSATPTEPTSEATATDPSTTTTADESSSSSSPTTPTSSSNGDACADVQPAENRELYNCDTTDPSTCPDCHKCTLTIHDDGLAEGTVCVPVADDPAGPFEPCSSGRSPGVDDCDAQTRCWNTDDDGDDDYCVPRCGEDGLCPEGTGCLENSAGAWGCIPECDPLAPDCPADNESCLPASDHFLCLPWEGLPGAGEPCQTLCGSGLACMSNALLPDCEADFCCTELCDPAGDPCSAPELTCLPQCITGSIPQGLSGCGIVPDPLPSSCPPAGIDPNIPWCSDSNDTACPKPDQGFGAGDRCGEECSCGTACDDVSQCPVPATGDATVLCEPLFEGKVDELCLLSCADGQTCPDGMRCSEAYPGRCMWFTELEPGCSGE